MYVCMYVYIYPVALRAVPPPCLALFLLGWELCALICAWGGNNFHFILAPFWLHFGTRGPEDPGGPRVHFDPWLQPLAAKCPEARKERKSEFVEPPREDPLGAHFCSFFVNLCSLGAAFWGSLFLTHLGTRFSRFWGSFLNVFSMLFLLFF